MEKYFDINDGCSIRCKLIVNETRNNAGGPLLPQSIDRVVIFCHGFGGHKDTRAASVFAERMNAKHLSTALLVFDWPCHGKDAGKHLTLEACDRYLSLVRQYAAEKLHAQSIYACGTSFGGYLLLKYTLEHGKSFEKIALRCPVVNMFRSMTERIIDEESLQKLNKGKEVLAGFDRKVKIDRDFLAELEACDLSKRDFLDYADDIMIVHGTDDEIIPYEEIRQFADDNVIEFLGVEGADHRFTNPKKMDPAIHEMIEFLGVTRENSNE